MDSIAREWAFKYTAEIKSHLVYAKDVSCKVNCKNANINAVAAIVEITRYIDDAIKVLEELEDHLDENC